LRKRWLEDGAEEAGQGLEGLGGDGAAAPVAEDDACAVALVVGKDGAHAAVEVAAVDHGVALKVVLE